MEHLGLIGIDLGSLGYILYLWIIGSTETSQKFEYNVMYLEGYVFIQLIIFDGISKSSKYDVEPGDILRAYADGELHYLEHHTIKKVANILNLSRDEIINAKAEIENFLEKNLYIFRCFSAPPPKKTFVFCWLN